MRSISLKTMLLLISFGNSIRSVQTSDHSEHSDLCSTNKVDNMYTERMEKIGGVWYSKIVIELRGHTHIWFTQRESVGTPLDFDPNNKILTKVLIEYKMDDCQDKCAEDCTFEGYRCEQLNRFHDLVLSFYTENGNYKYKYTRILSEDGNEVDVSEEDLPFEQKNFQSTDSCQYCLWPKHYINGSHPTVGYDYWSNELIYLKNAIKSSESTQVLRLNLKDLNVSSDNNNTEFNTDRVLSVTNMTFSHQFVGLFNYRNGSDRKIFAITEDMKIFEFFENKTFKETTLNFTRMIGCKSDQSSVNWTLIIIVVVIIVIIIIVLALLFLIVWKKVFAPTYYGTNSEDIGPKPDRTSVTRRSARNDAQTEVQTIMTVDSDTGKPIRDEKT